MPPGQGRAPSLPDSELPAVKRDGALHNEERVIAHTIRGLLALDYTLEKLELLIINDGSTDRTAEIVREFTEPQVRLLNVPPELAARGIGALTSR